MRSISVRQNAAMSIIIGRSYRAGESVVEEVPVLPVERDDDLVAVHLHVVAAHAQPLVRQRPARRDVELPLVPGAPDDGVPGAEDDLPRRALRPPSRRILRRAARRGVGSGRQARRRRPRRGRGRCGGRRSRRSERGPRTGRRQEEGAPRAPRRAHAGVDAGTGSRKNPAALRQRTLSRHASGS